MLVKYNMTNKIQDFAKKFRPVCKRIAAGKDVLLLSLELRDLTGVSNIDTCLHSAFRHVADGNLGNFNQEIEAATVAFKQNKERALIAMAARK